MQDQFGTVVGGVERDLQAQPLGEFDLAVVEERRALESLGGDPGEPRLRLRTPEVPVSGRCLAERERVVEHHSELDQPAGATVVSEGRHQQWHRTHEVRCVLEEPLPLDERLADQTEVVVLEVAEPAVHKTTRPRRDAAANVVHLNEHDAQAAQRSVQRDPDTVDACADDDQVVGGAWTVCHQVSCRRALRPRRPSSPLCTWANQFRSLSTAARITAPMTTGCRFGLT